MVETAKEPNPFMFKFAFDEFQLFVKEHHTQIDYDIDPVTKNSIDNIFTIENSSTFTMYQYFAN